MKNTGEKKKFHYAWLILIACCAIQAGGAGTLVNSAGVFFPEVSKSLGVGVGDFSFYFTITYIALALALPFAGKLFPKVNIRFLLSSAIIVCNLSVIAMSQFTATWQWYVAGAILGLAGSFIFIITTPIIIGNWFEKKLGLATGIGMAFNGVGGAIINPILSSSITNLGWRNGYLVMAGISLVLILPFTLFVIRFKPEDMGLKPYGHEELEEESSLNDKASYGVSEKVAVRSKAFMMMFIAFGLTGFLTGYSQQLPAFADSINFPATLGAMLVSISLLVSVCGKLILGELNDRFGIKKITIYGMGIAIFAFGLLIFSNGNFTMVLIGSSLYGITQTINAVAVPLITKKAFGYKDYSSIYSKLAVGQNLIGAFGFSAVGFIYDITGSYTPSFTLGAILCITFVILVLLGLASAKKLESNDNELNLAS